MRIWQGVLLLSLCSLLLVPAAHAAPDAKACLACHGAMQGSVEKEKGVLVDLGVDADKFAKSVHGSFNCVDCHMSYSGQPHKGPAATVDKAVQDLANSLSPKSKVDAVAQAACVNCHPDPYNAYKGSVHGKNVIVKKSSDGPVCTSCHGSPHYIQARPSAGSKVYLFNAVETCGKCHEEKFMAEKYGFSPLVMERYMESFHGRKLKLGHAGAPSCAKCHGSHGIVSAKDPKSPVNAANKKSTCGNAKCHPGATDKFVAAITHQPLHPVAHVAEIGLIILTVGTFMFIIIHVLLDIFADIRDRLFRKGVHHG
jgi:hypothetical protein